MARYEVREVSPRSGALGGEIRVFGSGVGRIVEADDAEGAALAWGRTEYEGRTLVKAAPEATRGPWSGWIVGSEHRGEVDEGGHVQVRRIG